MGACMVVALIVTLAGGVQQAAALPSPNLVISQIYGGGGNSGAPFTNDYIELFNHGTSPVDISGYSLQYASALGTGDFGGSSTQLTEIGSANGPPIILNPGPYFLVQEAGGAAGSPLPTADLVDPTPIP